jgi:ParB family chromosome partitioning protein
MQMQNLPIERIQIPERRRQLQLDKVQGLAESIGEIGLLNPIVVAASRLVAGRHRLEAVRLLGWETIPAIELTLEALDRELAEIDENLIRADLDVIERGDHYKRRKEIFLAKHPEWCGMLREAILAHPDFE